jgi:hypothetical protein
VQEKQQCTVAQHIIVRYGVASPMRASITVRHVSSCVQVLDVSRCGILDAGGAAICSALLQQDALRELHLSWNALSHGTAQALETVLR